MTNKTIQMNLTEQQFNLIWGVLNEYELEEELDIQVCNETLNEMEDIMEQLGLEKFKTLDRLINNTADPSHF